MIDKLNQWINLLVRYNLWGLLPLLILLSGLFSTSWFYFIKHELSVPLGQEKKISQVLTYQKNYWNNQIRLKFNTRKINSFKSLKSIELFVSESDLKRLNENLPQSGKRYVSSILLSKGEKLSGKFRYRGSAPLHWRSAKKSIRVKLDDGKQIFGLNQFELLAPSNPSLIDAYLAYQLAEKLDLLAPRVDLSWLTLNGEIQGLYLLVEPISEQTLVNAKQISGDIYAGDVAKKDEYIGADNHLFHNAALWQKVASSSDYARDHNAPLQMLIGFLNQTDIDYAKLRHIVDYPSFARRYLFNQLIISSNIDDFHNVRLYFDYSRGLFFPMIWDVEGWQDSKDKGNVNQNEMDDYAVQWHQLGNILLGDSEFILVIEREKQKLLDQKLFSSFPAYSKTVAESLRSSVNHDPMRFIDLTYFDTIDYQRESEALVNRIESRMSFLFDNWKFSENSDDRSLQLNFKAESIPQPVQWSGSKAFEGITHIRKPVKILPGTKILLGDNASLIFHNRVDVAGEKNARVVFKAADPDKPFGAIVIKSERANNSQLINCLIDGGSSLKNPLVNYSGMLSIQSVDHVLVKACHFKSSIKNNDMLHAVYSSLHISNSHFSDASGDAVDLELSKALIENSEFLNSANEGIDSMGSEIVIRNSQFVGNNDNALSVGQNSKVRVENSVFYENKIAILVKDSSWLRLSNSTLAENKRVIRLAHKNKHYVKGNFAFLYHNQIEKNRKLVKINKRSSLYLTDNFLSPSMTTIDKQSGSGWMIQNNNNDNEKRKQSHSAMMLHEIDRKVFESLDQKIKPQLYHMQRGAARISEHDLNEVRFNAD